MIKKPATCAPPMRTMRRTCAALVLLAAVFSLPLHPKAASSQEPDKVVTPSNGDEAIARATAAYREAIADGDFDAAAKFWTADADYADHLGHAFKMQAALAASKDRAQQGGRIARPPLKIATLAIRLVSPDVAIEDGIIERAAVGGDQFAKGRYCAVWVKRGNEWLIDGVRESAYSDVTSSNHFEDLKWMVGEWVAEGPEAKAEASCSWGPKKNYLVRQIQLRLKGAEPISMTQWIGWDPVHEQIRSFEFDSLGGFHDGVWTKDGEAWVVSTTGVAADGKRSTGTNVYSRVDDNTAIWESLEEESDGSPGIDMQLRATRKPRGKSLWIHSTRCTVPRLADGGPS